MRSQTRNQLRNETFNQLRNETLNDEAVRLHTN